jgi:glycosyltransferase involved in cell wall biosynthesis
MKILAIHSRNIFEQSGAGSNRWRTMIEGLAKKGVEIQILFIQGYGSIKEFKEYGWEGKIGDISYYYTTFLLHNSYWMKRITVYILSPMFKKLNANLVRKKIKLTNPDIIWLAPTIEVLETYLLAVSKLKITSYKLMIELNEFHDIGLVNSTNRLQLEISKRYSKILLSEILPKTDLLLIMTRNLLDYYLQFINPARAKFLHLPMTVDLNRFDMKKKPTYRYLAYCGSTSFIKDGVDILIKSFSIISKKYPDLRLKIAAFMQADGDNMIELIKELQLQDKIEYVGELKRDEIPDFIINAEMLLLPRPDSKQAMGGFPTKLGEYLASGNPVCATKVGEIPDYLVDNESAFLAQPGDIQSFVYAMERALANFTIAKSVGENGRKVAEKYFNMDTQASDLFEFIKKSIN